MSNSKPQQTRETELYKLNNRVRNFRAAILRELHADINSLPRGRIRVSYEAKYENEINIDLAGRFTQLREDVRRFAGDSSFDRLVPRVWYVPIKYQVLIVILIILIIFLIVPSLIWGLTDSIFDGVVRLVSYTIIMLLLCLLAVTSGGYKWLMASTIGTVSKKCSLLEEYLADIDIDIPNVTDLQKRVEHYRNLYLENEGSWRADIEQLKYENNQLREKLIGQDAPIEFEIDPLVLDKLNSLERIRLIEAVMAYKIQSWTPAAAVCGIILEGRLQTLCRENNISPGGFNKMIQLLGEAGLLKGHHQSLASVGQFFRHRSSHPTTEEFNKEKTTLVITMLIILIREVF